MVIDLCPIFCAYSLTSRTVERYQRNLATKFLENRLT
jgi:hypothetical protein